MLEEAARAYEQSVAIVPGAAVAWFNLALVHKHLRRWEDCRRANARVLEIDPKEEPAYWNLGIAATALRDWPTARKAWRGYGIEVPDGEGPIEMNFGSAPVRLNPDKKGEVVWARRIDPARAIVRNVPLPDSGFRWGDTVLQRAIALAGVVVRRALAAFLADHPHSSGPVLCTMTRLHKQRLKSVGVIGIGRDHVNLQGRDGRGLPSLQHIEHVIGATARGPLSDGFSIIGALSASSGWRRS